MAADAAMVLATLQLGDSAYPSGGFAFSWGLEGLAADGLVETAKDVADLAEEQLAHRWDTMDRVLLRRAFVAGDVAEVDRLAETVTWALPMRVGSRRAGRALLGVSARLGLEEARCYRALVEADLVLGHLPVVQALVFRASGLPLELAELLSGWTMITGLASAGVRLGLIGHLEAQGLITASRARLASLLARTPAHDARPSSFTPLAEIALARSGDRHLRLFAT